jgi:hypothetical protein
VLGLVHYLRAARINHRLRLYKRAHDGDRKSIAEDITIIWMKCSVTPAAGLHTDTLHGTQCGGKITVAHFPQTIECEYKPRWCYPITKKFSEAPILPYGNDSLEMFLNNSELATVCA